MSENRKEERENLKAFTPVFRLNPRSVLGYIEDLTLKGAMVIGEKSQEAGKQMTLSIEFPGSLPELNTPTMVIPARVAWCRKEENTDYFMIGFEFVDLSPENQKSIEALLHRYKFRRQTSLKDIE
ncbi:MAG: PilZ domain-containing protein [Anaerolineales bacterium]